MADYRENSSFDLVKTSSWTRSKKIADDSSPELILEDTKTVVAVGDTNTQTSEPNVRSD